MAQRPIPPERARPAIPEPATTSSQNRFLARLESPRRFPVIVAHRGDSFHAPENTLEAGQLAWEAGADAWELDVQLTRDGVPIVLHDESLLRTTNVADAVRGRPALPRRIPRLRLRFPRGQVPRRRFLVRRQGRRSPLGPRIWNP